MNLSETDSTPPDGRRSLTEIFGEDLMSKLAVLEGVTEGPFEPVPHTLVYQLITGAGDRRAMNLEGMLRALLFCQEHDVLPAFPEDWLIQVRGLHGHAFTPDAMSLESDRQSAGPWDTMVNLVEVADDHGHYLVSVETLLQCLQIACAQMRLPPLPQQWIESTLPALLSPSSGDMGRGGQS